MAGVAKMSKNISEKELIVYIRAGIERSKEVLAIITEYHGGPITTEYILTTDIAREFIERHYEVQVEYLNRKLVNGVTASKSISGKGNLGKKRSDIVILYDSIFPLAILEIKIGVKTIRSIKGDLDKISDTIDRMKPDYAGRIIGAVVFQIHIPGNRKRVDETDLKSAIEKVEKSLKDSLLEYAQKQKDFSYKMKPLQSKEGGIVGPDIDFENGQPVLARDGHATRYYAVLIKCTKDVPPKPRTVAELKARSRR